MSTINRIFNRELIEVRAVPDEVAVEINDVQGWDKGYITADEARALAAKLVDAADECAKLDWFEKENGDLVIVPKVNA